MFNVLDTSLCKRHYRPVLQHQRDSVVCRPTSVESGQVRSRLDRARDAATENQSKQLHQRSCAVKKSAQSKKLLKIWIWQLVAVFHT
jgi:hypothetical protein